MARTARRRGDQLDAVNSPAAKTARAWRAYTRSWRWPTLVTVLGVLAIAVPLATGEPTPNGQGIEIPGYLEVVVLAGILVTAFGLSSLSK
jgi:hypothetical protein